MSRVESSFAELLLRSFRGFQRVKLVGCKLRLRPDEESCAKRRRARLFATVALNRPHENSISSAVQTWNLELGTPNLESKAETKAYFAAQNLWPPFRVLQIGITQHTHTKLGVQNFRLRAKFDCRLLLLLLLLCRCCCCFSSRRSNLMR